MATAAGALLGRDRTRLAIAAAALVLLVVSVFAPVRPHDFVDYDDPEFVVENPRVAGGLSRASVRWAFAHAYDATGGPLTWLSHMLDVELFGMTPGPHHVVNAILHALNAVLLLIVLWRMTQTDDDRDDRPQRRTDRENNVRAARHRTGGPRSRDPRIDCRSGRRNDRAGRRSPGLRAMDGNQQ